MARYRGSVCRQCRREGVKLFLKGARCTTNKCSFERRSYAPGMHGQRRGKLSDYGLQLREKQKAKRIYGILEAQFRQYFRRAERIKGVTGTNLLVLLESRLDNVVYRSGFASSRRQARQLVRHSYFLVNDKKANIPSINIKTGDKITVHAKGTELASLVDSVKNKQGAPKWLDVDYKNLTAQVEDMPAREDIEIPVKEQLIVELYSK